MPQKRSLIQEPSHTPGSLPVANDIPTEIMHKLGVPFGLEEQRQGDLGDAAMALAGLIGPMFLSKLKMLKGITKIGASEPSNPGDALLRSHDLPPTTELSPKFNNEFNLGKGKAELKTPGPVQIEPEMLKNGGKRTTPDRRKPK